MTVSIFDKINLWPFKYDTVYFKFTKKILIAIVIGFAFGAAMKFPPLKGFEAFVIYSLIDFIAQMFIIFIE